MLSHGKLLPLFLLAAAPAAAEDMAPHIVVTASRSGEGIRTDQLGASITVVNEEDLHLRQTRIISDVLRDVPGVAVSRAGVAGGLTDIRVRGAESNHVLILIDGIEVSDPYQGLFDFGTLIADPVGRIEVLRGQQSSLYGSDAIGGVIHYITPTGAEAPGIHLHAEGGSFGTFNGGARFAGVAGALDYAVSASYQHMGGTPTARAGVRDIGSDSVGLSGKLIWSPSESLKLTAVGRYNFIEADLNNTDFDPTSPTFGHVIDSPDTYYRNHAFHGLLRADVAALDGRWNTALSGQFSDTKRRSYEFGPLAYATKGRRYKGSMDSSFRFDTGDLAHRVTAAVDLEREEFQNLTPSAFQGRRDTTNTGLVGQYELLFRERLSVGASIRHDWNNRFSDATTWRVQGSYALPTGTRLHAAYGTGIKNPGYFELYGYFDGTYIGNPDLRSEKSRGWEAGVEQTFGDDVATLGATWFNSRLKNEIYVDYPAPAFVARPFNRATDSTQKGLEVYLRARPVRQLQVDASYTWLNARENGVRELRRPRHIGSFNATLFSADERLSGTVTIRYNGRQFDHAYTDPSYEPVLAELREYVLINLGAQYKVSEHVSVHARVENLLNERYEEVFSFVGAGRAAYGGVSLRF